MVKSNLDSSKQKLLTQFWISSFIQQVFFEQLPESLLLPLRLNNSSSALEVQVSSDTTAGRAGVPGGFFFFLVGY